ncbi:hypothetical protein [Shewanella frigidimarina]|nr:hypothetical protein [Shewanella frigidimarina]
MLLVTLFKLAIGFASKVNVCSSSYLSSMNAEQKVAGASFSMSF